MKKEFEEIRKSKYFKYIVAFGIIKKVILLLLFISLVFSCSGSDDENGVSLRIVNRDAVTLSVIQVAFVGYEFKNLNIAPGEEKTFSQLTIPSGTKNVNIDITFRCTIANQVFTRSISKDFDNQTTVWIADPDPNDTTPMNCWPARID
ncbi:MAG: hypothetical protein CMC38_06710 [Flavobacteriaceae bacterium]|nr:hypothetical protein [Flavobacteriaceae bacterium]|tara:strand:+ start:486 stop:929 length:444 start_codon:yes stop_codon:yes gene_type:complete